MGYRWEIRCTFQQPEDTGSDSPDTEMFDVELIKDSQGLGITIAGYIGGEKSSSDGGW